MENQIECGAKSELGHICRMEPGHNGNHRYSATEESEANRQAALHADMTTAEKVAQLFDNDGQNWTPTDDSGRSMAEVCEGLNARHERRFETNRWVFRDGSSIVAERGGWDLGYGDSCWCWAGEGDHRDGCEARAAEVR